MKKIILLIIIIFAGIGYYHWKSLNLTLLELNSKDPEKYKQMIIMAKSFEYKGAKKLFNELEAMTESEVIMLRFKKMKKKWESGDDKYRKNQMIKQYKIRKNLKKNQSKSYESRTNEVVIRPVREEELWLDKYWRKTPSWEKGLILRQKCIYYMEKEKQGDAYRLFPLNLPRSTVYLKTPETAPVSSRLCESWIPLSENEAAVPLALQNLRQHLNYFYLKEMIRDLGIPEETVLNFESKTQRLIDDYS